MSGAGRGLGAALALALASCAAPPLPPPAPKPPPPQVPAEFRALVDVFQTVKTSYVTPVDERALAASCTSGFRRYLASLSPPLDPTTFPAREVASPPGIGTIQTIFPTSGSTAIKLTTAKFYRPNGEAMEGNPVIPDVLLPAAEAALPSGSQIDLALPAARKLLSK